MYHHVKELMYTVRVDEADPRFGNMLLEQFGGANGELGAAMQHSVQGLNCDDPERKDLLMDIASKSETVQGHVGLIEEGDEVIEEAKEKDGVAADLALIASAQKTEHYEISAYGTARTMAGQIGLPAVPRY